MNRLMNRFKRHITDSHGPQSVCERASMNMAQTAATEETSTSKESEHLDDSRLERLPPEVRRHILSILDLTQLRALVHASPIFHQQYLIDRRYLLCKNLEATLGSLTVHAYAVHQLVAPRNTPDVLEWYAEKSSQRTVPITKDLTEGAASSIAGFYLRLVKPVVEYCARWMMANLVKASKNHDYQQEIQPSRTEMTRLTRAAYRFQLLCQLASPERTLGPSRENHLWAFLSVIEPWEIEELFAFYQFAYGIYDKVFTDIYWDLHPNNPKFDGQGRPPTPDGAFDLDIGFLRDNFLEGTTLRGLSLLHTVLFQIKDHEGLVSTMQEQIQSSYIPVNGMVGLFGETQQILRRETHPSERFQMEADRVPLVFVRDELDRPPRAWTMIWGDTYSNLHGCHIPDEMRYWGYIFWDQATLEKTGGTELVKLEWEEYWGDYDPRDD